MLEILLLLVIGCTSANVILLNSENRSLKLILKNEILGCYHHYFVIQSYLRRSVCWLKNYMYNLCQFKILMVLHAMTYILSTCYFLIDGSKFCPSTENQSIEATSLIDSLLSPQPSLCSCCRLVSYRWTTFWSKFVY
jgi:hypothetical protein